MASGGSAGEGASTSAQGFETGGCPVPDPVSGAGEVADGRQDAEERRPQRFAAAGENDIRFVRAQQVACLDQRLAGGDPVERAFLAAWQYKMHSEFGDDRMLRSDEHDAARAYNASRHERRRLQGFQLVLGVEPVGESSNAFQDAVARLQRRAGVAADGRVNEHTEAALKALAEAMAKYATSYAAGVQVA